MSTQAPLSSDEAIALTGEIRDAEHATARLLHDAEIGGAHTALGYATFTAYARDELGMAQSTVYKHRNAYNVECGVSEALGVHIPEVGSTAYVGVSVKKIDAVADYLRPTVASGAPVTKELIKDALRSVKSERQNRHIDSAQVDAVLTTASLPEVQALADAAYAVRDAYTSPELQVRLVGEWNTLVDVHEGLTEVLEGLEAILTSEGGVDPIPNS